MSAALAVEGLVKHFRLPRGSAGANGGGRTIRAVDGVSFAIAAGATLALVGESGCGKTTTARLVTRLLEPDRGRILLGETDLAALGERRLRPHRRRIQIVFQDPSRSLDPRWTVRRIVAEPLRIHRQPTRQVTRLLEQVGLAPAVAVRHPDELSTGQRQRVALARALALDPEVLVLDEPVSALDVSVRAQILNLLAELQQERGLAYLFVTHDLALVPYLADEVAVMYLGRIVERGPVDVVMERPRHHYTRALLDAVPTLDPSAAPHRLAASLAGDLPSPVDLPSGCRFRTRCSHAQPRCEHDDPVLDRVDDDPDDDPGGQEVACHFPL